MTYTVKIKRKPLYYFTQAFIPTLVFSFLLLLVFVQPIGAGERNMYTITLVTALCFMMTSIEYLPSSSEGVPLSTSFMLISLVTMTIISFIQCFIITTYYGLLGTSNMPKLIRKYVLEYLGNYLGCRLQRKLPAWREKLNLIKEVEQRLHDVDVYGSKRNSARLYGTEKRHSASDGHTIDEKLKQIIFQVKKQGQEIVELERSKESIGETLEGVVGKEGVSQLNSAIDLLLNTFVDEDDEEWTQREWKTLSTILDTLFLRISSASIFMLCAFCVFHAVS